MRRDGFLGMQSANVHCSIILCEKIVFQEVDFMKQEWQSWVTVIYIQ